jgi:hypothetical protein
LLIVPEPALPYGFLNDPVGTHGSRTLMLKELRLLLTACPRPASYEDFRTAVIQHNVLLKNTDTTRQESFRRLRELYAIDENTLLFRALRDLWDEDETAQPLLALLCACARDSILRSAADPILATPIDEPVTPQMMEESVRESFPNRYNATTLATIGRNVASSWQQSGHLRGHLKKVRHQADCQPTAVAYALLLGYLGNLRGEALFQTLWCCLLDAPAHILHRQAQLAAQGGWLEYRHSGSVTDITFRYLLRTEEGHES